MAGIVALVFAYATFWLTHVSFTLPWATLLALAVAMLVHPLAARVVGKGH